MATGRQSSGKIQVELGALRGDLKRYADSQDMTLAECVRLALRKLLGHNHPPRFGFERGKFERPTKTCKTYLTPSEHSALQACASVYGLSEARWVHWLIRTKLTGSPHFGQYELDALTASNLALLKLNRRLVALSVGSDLVNDEVRTLVDQIEQHTFLVSELVRSNQMRWAIRELPDA